jgi:glycosyltransferase involved in cell wall biosynthesis
MTEVAGLRVAIVNWRDPWHPAAGGAESYAWELARRFAAQGARVRYVTARAPGQLRRGRVEDVEFIRMGGTFTLYPLVLLWMWLRRRSFDAVIDCQNGIPFFTPWVLPRRTPVFCLIHHVHDGQFGLYFPAWLAWVGRTLEGPVARWSYRRHACVVVSLTTLRALRERLGWRGPAYVIPVGVTIPEPGSVPAGLTPRATDPGRVTLVCVSRLVPHKRVERLLDLADRLRDRWPGLRVHIVGDGPSAPKLAKEVADRGLADVVILHGFVSEAEKAALVTGSDLNLSATQGEGWGLSVAEAAALGVPTVAYDVDGMRDAVRDGRTGWLVHDGERFDGVVERALGELADPQRRHEMAEACRRWGGEFDWARTAARMAAQVAAAVRAGSPHSTDDGARVVRRYGDEAESVVEGPVRDELLQDPGRATDLRPATPLERLLGRVDEGAW